MESELYNTQDQQWMGPIDSQFMPKIVQRRAKRSIPDNDKDDKYWEKRKRNNMAAKRSRECKRQAESDVKNKVTFLEEDNALLRKEICLMKAKFGIPLDQSFLTQDDRSQCMHDLRNNRSLHDNGTKSESEDGSDNSMMSPTGARYSLAALPKPVSPYDRMNGDMRRQHEQARFKGSDMNVNGYEVYASWNQVPCDNTYLNPQVYQNGDSKYPNVPHELMDKHAIYANYERYLSESDGVPSARSGYQYYGYQSQPIYPGTPADLTLSRKPDGRTGDECTEFMKKQDNNNSINSSPLKLPIKAEYYTDQKAMLMKHHSQLADSTTNTAAQRADLSSSSQEDEYFGNSESDLKCKLHQIASPYSDMKK